MADIERLKENVDGAFDALIEETVISEKASVPTESPYGFGENTISTCERTSTAFKSPSSAVFDVMEAYPKYFEEGMTGMEYGAGREGRNTKPLHEAGMIVYSYDPHYNNGNPWEFGGVSNEKLDVKFDVVFSGFVLNVLTEVEQQKVIAEVEKLVRPGGLAFHFTRHKDIYVMLSDINKASHAKKFDMVLEYLKDENYSDKSLIEKLENRSYHSITKQQFMEACMFGIPTSKGFQRIPLTPDGYTPIKSKTKSDVIQIFLKQM